MSSASDTELIADDAGLASLVDRLRGRAWIAVDSEFLTDRSYVPRLCLVQVASEDVVACVDVLQSLSFEPLWALLRDPGITKVFHAAENDLAVLRRPAGGIPGPVFDTQVAGRLSQEHVAVRHRVELGANHVGAARVDYERRRIPRYAAGRAVAGTNAARAGSFDEITARRIADRQLVGLLSREDLLRDLARSNQCDVATGNAARRPGTIVFLADRNRARRRDNDVTTRT